MKRIVRHFFEKNKPVAAICHGPLLLTSLGVVKRRRMTGYIAVKPDIKAFGAEYLDQEVVVDSNLVTSRVWPDLPAFMRSFIEFLRK